MPRKPVNPGSAEPSTPARTAGRTMADVLALPDPLRQLATWMLRQDAVSLEQVVAHLGQETEQVRALLDTLVVERVAQHYTAAGDAAQAVPSWQRAGQPARLGRLGNGLFHPRFKG